MRSLVEERPAAAPLRARLGLPVPGRNGCRESGCPGARARHRQHCRGGTPAASFRPVGEPGETPVPPALRGCSCQGGAFARRPIRSHSRPLLARARAARAASGRRSRSFPNTVGPQPQIRVRDTGPRMVFSGSLDYEPNLDAVRWLIGEILRSNSRRRALEAELVVAGREPDAGDPLALRGGRGGARRRTPPRSILSIPRPASRSRRCASEAGPVSRSSRRWPAGRQLSPLNRRRKGSTSIPGRDLLVATDQAQFVESCVSLLRDPGRAAELGARARETWACAYSSDRAQEQIIALVERVLSSKAAGAHCPDVSCGSSVSARPRR